MNKSSLALTSAALMIVAGQSAVAADPKESDTKKYLKRTYGPVAVGRATAGGALDHLEHEPSEWGQGASGFGLRVASAFGFHIVKKSIEFPISKLHHEEYGYHPSDKTGAKARLVYALTSVVITRKTTDGSKTFHAGEVSGALGAGLISRLWQPASTRTIGLGFSSAGTTLAIDAGYNVVREFWPEIRHPHSHAAVRAARLSKLAGNREVEVTERDRED